MAPRRIVVIGASAGGVRALQLLTSQLPPEFPAPILAVQHVGTHPSILPSLLQRSGPLPASHAVDGERIQAGRILVAPPDHHMIVDGDFIRLSRGPKENHARPAIDPLFRSAAMSWGPAAIAVLLTGLLDDGTAGMQAIKRCGGTAVVQDPNDAEMPSMPLSALRHVDVDHQVALASMASVLLRLVERDVGRSAERVAAGNHSRLLHENELALGKGDFMEHLKAIGKPSTFVCPDCDGALWELGGEEPRRFRCHTGHAFTLRSLHHAQSETADEALWSALRALQEKEMLLRAMADGHRGTREQAEAERLDAEASEIEGHAATLRRLIEAVPAPPE